jgi:hypothetical protein
MGWNCYRLRMKSLISSVAVDVRTMPDVMFLVAVMLTGEAAAVAVCLYFAFTFPHNVV